MSADLTRSFTGRAVHGQTLDCSYRFYQISIHAHALRESKALKLRVYSNAQTHVLVIQSCYAAKQALIDASYPKTSKMSFQACIFVMPFAR